MKTHFANSGFTGFGTFQKTHCARYYASDVLTTEVKNRVTCEHCKKQLKEDSPAKTENASNNVPCATLGCVDYYNGMCCPEKCNRYQRVGRDVG